MASWIIPARLTTRPAHTEGKKPAKSKHRLPRGSEGQAFLLQKALYHAIKIFAIRKNYFLQKIF